MTVMLKGHRKCDESCYDAKGNVCHCVCNGKNHGLGLEHVLGEESDAQKIAKSEEGEDE